MEDSSLFRKLVIERIKTLVVFWPAVFYRCHIEGHCEQDGGGLYSRVYPDVCFDLAEFRLILKIQALTVLKRQAEAFSHILNFR